MARITAGREFHPAPKVGRDNLRLEYNDIPREFNLFRNGFLRLSLARRPPRFRQVFQQLFFVLDYQNRRGSDCLGKGEIQGPLTDGEFRAGILTSENTEAIPSKTLKKLTTEYTELQRVRRE